MNPPLSILVVDDDDAGRAMLGLSLRQGGYRVKTVSGGGQALKLLHRERFDVLVTDARMSPIDGFELSSRAKNIQPGLRILMMSAVFTDRDAANFPIDGFYPKPVPMERLMSWLASAA